MGIVTQDLSDRRRFGRKPLLTAIATAVIASPIMFGLVNASPKLIQSTRAVPTSSPSFEVTSVKLVRAGDGRFFVGFLPGRFKARGMTTKSLIKFAYGVKDDRLLGGPSWINTAKYDIEATIENLLDQQLLKLPPAQAEGQRSLMLQSLFADRFKLKLNHEAKVLPIYALVIAKHGSKLKKTKTENMIRTGWTELVSLGVPVAVLADQLSMRLGRTVVDKTGLKGSYAFTLNWTPDQSIVPTFRPESGQQGAANTSQAESSGPSIFTALEEQLGLKLESQKGLVEVLVIDHVEKPSEN